jgi:hypothetical protein
VLNGVDAVDLEGHPTDLVQEATRVRMTSPNPVLSSTSR